MIIITDEIEEFKKILHAEPKVEKYKSKIFYDGKQYSVRIPVKLAKTLVINPKTDYILFKITYPSKITEKPKLEISLENATK